MSRIDFEQLKTLITSALKPIELKISEIFTKIDGLNSELIQLKSVVLLNNDVSSSKVVTKDESADAHAPSTPVSTSNTTTPTSRPAPASTHAPARAQRPAAARTRERIAALAKQPLRAKRNDQPAKHEPRQSMADKKVKMAQNQSVKDVNIDESYQKPINTEPSSVASQETVPHSGIPADNDYITYQSRHNRRKHRKSTVTIKGTATNSSIKGVAVYKFLHGCYFKKDTTPDTLINHLKSIYDDERYTVEKIQSKRDSYNSFKIGIPTAVYENFLSTTAWPINTYISEWRPFLRPRETQSPADDCATD
jgi:hypothetical protein